MITGKELHEHLARAEKLVYADGRAMRPWDELSDLGRRWKDAAAFSLTSDLLHRVPVEEPDTKGSRRTNLRNGEGEAMSEEITKCCANCEQGEPLKNKDGSVRRIKCTPFLTPWLNDWVRRNHDGNSLFEYTNATDGAECDCFIPRGNRNG